jgi:hypothetical protein
MRMMAGIKRIDGMASLIVSAGAEALGTCSEKIKKFFLTRSKTSCTAASFQARPRRGRHPTPGEQKLA